MIGPPEASDVKTVPDGSAVGWRVRLADSWTRIARVQISLPAMRLAARSFVTRNLANENRHLFALTILVGLVCGLAAVAFHLTIRAAEHLMIERAMNARGSTWMAWAVISPTAAGLLAGALLTWLVPGARGSGIPQVKVAFATEGGRVRFRDALGKFFIGALQIGSGASLGREGPTVQVCAGATSLLARATSLPPRNMRRLTPVGVAAGIAAAFNAPIAAVTFTIEEIVGTLDQAVLSGVVVAAALAAVIERGILGGHPVIEVRQPYAFDHPSTIGFYAVLGIAAALVSIAFTDGLLKLRLWFRGLRMVPTWTHPAIGGMVTGILAVLVFRFLGTTGITGGGYETLGRALEGELGLRVLVVLCAGKLIATVFSYSSGGAGGIFAPALFVGAMLGGAVGRLDVLLMHHEPHQIGAFAVVGMGAVFAGVIRAPITSVLIIFEMTGGYGLVLPLMLANVTSYVIAHRLRPTPIYEALLEQDGIVLPHGAPIAAPRAQLLVSDAMTTNVITVRVEQTTAQVRELLAAHNFSKLPVVDEAGAIVGTLSAAELRGEVSPPDGPTAAHIKPPHVIKANAPLLSAIVRMNDLGVRQLLVVDPLSETKLVGILAMSDLVRAHTSAKPMVRDPSSKVTGPPEARSMLKAEEIMAPSAVVSAATDLSQLAAQLEEGPVRALVVREVDHAFGVVLPEYLTEFSGDEDLERMLIATDVARRAWTVDAGADLTTMSRTMVDHGSEAVVVLDGKTAEPIGVVTKTALAMAFFDWYISSSSASSAPLAG